MPDVSNKDRFSTFIYYLTAAFLLVMFFSLFNRFFDPDEITGLHSTWYVAQGDLPYVDFFQHRHPLLWYMLAPLHLLFGDAWFLLLLGRGVMCLFALGSIVVVYRLGMAITSSKEIGLLGSLMLLSNVAFSEKAIEIRPETPHLFWALLSVYYLVLYVKRPAAEQETRPYLVQAAVFAAVSFLFLQNTVFLLLGYLAYFIYMYVKRRLSLKAAALFFLVFFICLLPLPVYLLVTGSFSEYILSNWLVPSSLIASFESYHTLVGLLIENLMFWILCFLIIYALVSKKKLTAELRLLLFLGVVVFIFPAFLGKLPYKQNFLLTIGLFSIPAAYSFKVVSFYFNFSESGKIKMLSLGCLLPFLLLGLFNLNSNSQQLEEIRFVLHNSQPTDLVYDEAGRFNLFRRDLHYFWYGLGKNEELATYEKLTGKGNLGRLDVYRLIREKAPKFISSSHLIVGEGGLKRSYKTTPYKDLYVRRSYR